MRTDQPIKMLYKTVTFACVAGATAFTPMSGSKLSSSKVARSSCVEMAKKSVCAIPCVLPFPTRR